MTDGRRLLVTGASGFLGAEIVRQAAARGWWVRGLSRRAFDGRGNYSLGVREQIIFPEIDYDQIDQVRGLDITITTTASSDDESFALLEALGMPFARDNRPTTET